MRVRGVWLKLRALLVRNRVERELDDEIRFHLEMEIEANRRRGLPPAEARREAYRRFGGVERFKEQARDVRGTAWLEDGARDVREGFRVLIRRPGFALAAVVTLALGVGLNTAIYSVVAGTLLAPFPYPDADRLVVLGSTIEERGWDFASLSIPELEELDSEIGSFDEVAVFRSGVPVTVTGDGHAAQVRATFVTSAFLPLLGAEPVRGRLFGPEIDGEGSGQSTVIISNGFWQTHLGERPQPVGSQVILSGAPYTIIGVLPPSFHGLSADPGDAASLWLPLSMGPSFFGGNMYETRLGRQFLGLARLTTGAGPESAREELGVLASRLESEYPVEQVGRGFAAFDLRRFFHGGLSDPLTVLLGGALLVLLICAVNVGALLLVRGLSRSRELAVRTALGARRSRLVRQLLTEALVLALIGGALGVAVAFWGLPVVLHAFAVDLPAFEAIAVDEGVFVVSLLGVLAVGLLFGLYPALRGTRVAPGSVLRSRTGSSEGTASGRGRQLLVAGEVALAVVLLVGAGLTAKSLQRLATSNVGYEADGLLTLRLDMTGAVPDSEYAQFVQRVLDEVQGLPEVEAATAWGPSMIGSAGWHVGVSPPGTDPSDPEERVLAQRLLVSAGGLEVLGVDVVGGRTFRDSDRLHEGWPVLIDRRLANAYWPDRDPVGRELPMSSSVTGSGNALVVGVAESVRHRGRLARQEGVVGDVYFLYDHRPVPTVSLLVRPHGGEAGMQGLAERIQETVGRLNASVPVFDAARMTERLRREEATPRFTATLMSVYALVAILLALVGTYGLLAYTLRQRMRELAVRVALGARRGELLWLTFRQGLAPALVGIAAGAVLALGATRLMESFLFQVSVADRQVFLTVILTVLLTSAAASFLPAHRAAGVTPMHVLREE